MEKVACKGEHRLEPEVEESICTLLGHPGVCPDENRFREAGAAARCSSDRA